MLRQTYLRSRGRTLSIFYATSFYPETGDRILKEVCGRSRWYSQRIGARLERNSDTRGCSSFFIIVCSVVPIGSRRGCKRGRERSEIVDSKISNDIFHWKYPTLVQVTYFTDFNSLGCKPRSMYYERLERWQMAGFPVTYSTVLYVRMHRSIKYVWIDSHSVDIFTGNLFLTLSR